MERDEILKLIQDDPKSIVLLIQRLIKTCALQEARIAELERQINQNQYFKIRQTPSLRFTPQYQSKMPSVRIFHINSPIFRLDLLNS